MYRMYTPCGEHTQSRGSHLYGLRPHRLLSNGNDNKNGVTRCTVLLRSVPQIVHLKTCANVKESDDDDEFFYLLNTCKALHQPLLTFAEPELRHFEEVESSAVSSSALQTIGSLTRLAKTCILHAAGVSIVSAPAVLSSWKFCEHTVQQVQHLISGLPERVSHRKPTRALGWKSV